MMAPPLIPGLSVTTVLKELKANKEPLQRVFMGHATLLPTTIKAHDGSRCNSRSPTAVRFKREN